MSMPIGFASKVSLFSMRRRLIRTILSLIPCVLLIAVMFIGSTIPNGLVNEIDEKVLKNAESRQEIVVLDSYLFSTPDFSKTGGNGPQDMSFNNEAFDLATKAPQVAEVYPQFGQADGVIESLGNVRAANVAMAGTSPEFAKLYTPESFAFVEGQPIPILINPNQIGAQEYQWNGATTFELDYGNIADAETKMGYTTLKESDDLVGSTFTAEFGAFPGYPLVFEEQSMSSGFGPPKSKIIQLTNDDRSILDRRVNEIYGSYWDLNQLRTPIKLEFKIVGMVKGQNTPIATMIPNDAVPYIWNKIYQRQASARSAKTIDKELLSTDPKKIEVREGKLATNGFGNYSQSIFKDPSVSAWQVDISSIGIPGLLVESTKNSRGQNEYRELAKTVITADNFDQTAAIVRLNSADEREAYVKYLNDNNLSYYDNSPLGLIKGVRKGANIFVTWLTIILGSIVALILLTTVSRFVADSRKEIGVWRAIGATRLDITKLVLVRMSMLLVFGIGFGVVVGYGISALLSGVIANQVNEASSSINPYGTGGNFIGSIVLSFLGGVVPNIEASKLLATNWQLLGSRLGLLALITLVVGLIPALRAARISPVTAMRDSE